MRRKTALVTGGTSGVGLSIVRELVKSGAHVHFIGTNADKGRGIEEELDEAGGSRCRFVQLDLRSLRSVRDFARSFAPEGDALDVLVNVAGVLLPQRQVTPEGNEVTFAVNYLSAVVLCRELTPLLGRAPHGRIANVAGAPAHVLKPNLDFDDLQVEKKYSLVRAAMNAVHAKTVMTEILAERLAGDGIDVNAFHPGTVKSDLARSLPFPLRQAAAFGGLFMSNASRSGIYVSTAEELNGVTGQLFVGTKGRPLSFAQAYKDQLEAATDRIIAAALSAGAG